MRLELATFPVRDLVWGSQTAYNDGLLTLNKEELIGLVRQETKFAGAEMEIARPGEDVRIVQIRDVVEPRCKAGGPGGIFPGTLSPIHAGGQGVTNRLSGMAVVTCVNYRSAIKAGTGAPSTSMLDMSGPGAPLTPLGSTRNLVIVGQLVDGISENEAHSAMQMAELRIAERLAKTTLGLEPAATEVFELTPTPASLPRVVYIIGIMTGPNPAIALYGLPIFETLPTFIHPNEFFDGAVTTDVRRGKNNVPRLWEFQNQPVIQELYNQHGKTLHFLGVILHRMSANTVEGKQIGALCAARMASMMGAQGAVITRVNVSGNRFIDIMLTLQACEQNGIKTVLLSPEYSGKNGDELPFLFTVPEAQSIVNTGSFERKMAELPAPQRVIGPRMNGQILMDLDPVQGRPPVPAGTPLALDGWDNIAGGVDWWGRGKLRAEDF